MYHVIYVLFTDEEGGANCLGNLPKTSQSMVELQRE